MQVVLDSLLQKHHLEVPSDRIVVTCSGAASPLADDANTLLRVQASPQDARVCVTIVLYDDTHNHLPANRRPDSHFGVVFAFFEGERGFFALHETLSFYPAFEGALGLIRQELSQVVVTTGATHRISAKPQRAGSNACGIRAVFAVDTFLRHGAFQDVEWDQLGATLDQAFRPDEFRREYAVGQDDDGRAHFCGLLRDIYDGLVA
jgi:hypothetical protein